MARPSSQEWTALQGAVLGSGARLGLAVGHEVRGRRDSLAGSAPGSWGAQEGLGWDCDMGGVACVPRGVCPAQCPGPAALRRCVPAAGATSVLRVPNTPSRPLLQSTVPDQGPWAQRSLP